MTYKLIWKMATVACLLWTYQIVFAQTRRDIASKFKVVTAYEIHHGIVLIPEFDKEGNICRAVIEPLVNNTKNERLQTVISDQVADELIEEVVPDHYRGHPIDKYYSSDSVIAGGIYVIKKEYELVSIEKMGNIPQVAGENTIQVIRIIWKNKNCENRVPYP